MASVPFNYLPKESTDFLDIYDVETYCVKMRFHSGNIAIITCNESYNKFKDYFGDCPESFSDFIDCVNCREDHDKALVFLQEEKVNKRIAFSISHDPLIALQEAYDMWLQWFGKPQIVRPVVSTIK